MRPTPEPAMDFADAEAYLNRLQMFKIKLGLETTRSLLAGLGNPHKQLNIIHIAGTNGKGSVGATLSTLFTTAGYRTGFYSSPHLASVRERFRLNHAPITTGAFAGLVARLSRYLGNYEPTYFECTTLLALLWFAEERADVVILETGMGGRLDATNVVTPLISLITDISLDHQQYLGHSIPEIAAEKAGIIKPGVPVLFSGRDAGALPVITGCCRYLRCPLLVYGQDFESRLTSATRFDFLSRHAPARLNLPLPLAGAHQAVNASLALAALDLLTDQFPTTEAHIRAGLAAVRWPGRLELIEVASRGQKLRVLLDGAHNEAGVLALCQALEQGFPRRRLVLVWANMADKHLGQAFLHLATLADTVFFTRANLDRSANPANLLRALPPELQAKARCVEHPIPALTEALEGATPDDLICVAGSLYLVGLLRSHLVSSCNNYSYDL